MKNLKSYLRTRLSSADVFENFRKMCLKIYLLDPAKFLSVPGLARQALKKIEGKLELSTDTDMLLIIEKWIRGEICHAIHRYAIANNKYMKNDYNYYQKLLII